MLGITAYALIRGVHPYDMIQINSLNDSPERVVDVWTDVYMTKMSLFTQVVEFLTGYDCRWCSDCRDPAWEDEITTTYSGHSLCDSCRDGNYSYCEGCDNYFHDSDVTTVDDTTLCDRRCVPERASFCDECDEYYLDSNSDEHNHSNRGCNCEAPRPTFEFPANGDGTVSQDERLRVELASGVVSAEGLLEMDRLLTAADLTAPFESYRVRNILHNLDPTWQKKEGNFTRRLSKALYTQLRIKLSPSLMSEIGNIGRRHTASEKEFWVEFTRDLNGTAEDFYHDDSCWWTDHSSSRCALKCWGGIGMRSYYNEDIDRETPSGRAWIQPLDENLQPTHTTVGAHAFVVYNGYGKLENYAPARIVAHLTGRTYRQVGLYLSPQYVNGSSGFLIADEETCKKTERVEYSANQHHTTDHTTLQEAAA